MGEEYILRDRVKELENVNFFVKNNTLNSVLNRLVWLKEKNGNLDQAIEIVKSMLNPNSLGNKNDNV